METFSASVQYNDLKGTAAADRGDMHDAQRWLQQNGHITDEYVAGISMWAGENDGVHRDPVSVKFLVSALGGHASVPEKISEGSDSLQFRVIRVDMPIAEFLSMFKRLEVTLSIDGLIEGKQYSEE